VITESTRSTIDTEPRRRKAYHAEPHRSGHGMAKVGFPRKLVLEFLIRYSGHQSRAMRSVSGPPPRSRFGEFVVGGPKRLAVVRAHTFGLLTTWIRMSWTALCDTAVDQRSAATSDHLVSSQGEPYLVLSTYRRYCPAKAMCYTSDEDPCSPDHA